MKYLTLKFNLRQNNKKKQTIRRVMTVTHILRIHNGVVTAGYWFMGKIECHYGDELLEFN